MRIRRSVHVLWPMALALTSGCGSSGGNKAIASGSPTPTPDGGSATADAGGGDGASAPLVLGPDDVDEDLPMPLAAGIAPTPPMGWNSWNNFATGVSDALIRQVADAIVSSGMQAAGYQYVNIDDGWARTVGGALPTRDASGNILPDPVNFPNGIGPVADYVHSQGLKLGIYSDRGTATCDGKMASQGFEMSDATSFASWGVDYLKYDNCNATLDIETQYQTMGSALLATGRPFVFSLCAWNFYEWSIGTGALWRTTGDITPYWTPPSPGQGSIFANIMSGRTLAAYSGPMKYMVNPAPGGTAQGPSTADGVAYGWNDADMLEVGAAGLNATENQSHFSLWAVTAAPLIAGNDVRSMSATTKGILTNPEIIAVDQDALGLAGVAVWTSSDINQSQSVWAKPLNASGVRAVVLLNGGETASDVTFHLSDIGLRTATAQVRDLVAHQDLAPITDSYTAPAIPPHGSVTLKVSGVEPARPHGTAFLSDLQSTYAANGLGNVHKDEADTVAIGASHAPLTLRGAAYTKGLGADGPSFIVYRLAQKCSTFTADVGVDDVAGGYGSVVFQVWSDGEKLFDSGIVTGASPVQSVHVALAGKRRLMLLVTNGGDGTQLDRADWANAQVVCDP